jgi:hypothetical protein
MFRVCCVLPSFELCHLVKAWSEPYHKPVTARRELLVLDRARETCDTPSKGLEIMRTPDSPPH